MKLSDRLIARCSPVQLNAMACLGIAACMLAAVLGFRLLPTVMLPFLILALLGAAIALFRLAALGMCPKCGASPFFGRPVRLPTRHCPDCGQDLAIIVRYD